MFGLHPETRPLSGIMKGTSIMAKTFTPSPVETAAPARLTVQGVPLPDVCTVKQARALAKSLMGRATEASFIMSKTTPASLTAYAVGCALLGAADNQGAPLERLTALAGEKASKAVKDRLHVVAQATAAGRAAFKAGADTLSLVALFSGPALTDLTDAGQQAAAERAAARAALEAQERANAAAAARTEKAVSDRLADAAKAASLALDREVMEAYRMAHLHGASMDNTAAPRAFEALALADAQAQAQAQAQAARQAQLDRWAAQKADDAADEEALRLFLALASRFGVTLTGDQEAQARRASAGEVAQITGETLPATPAKRRIKKAA